jgi:hypothetical protein
MDDKTGLVEMPPGGLRSFGMRSMLAGTVMNGHRIGKSARAPAMTSDTPTPPSKRLLIRAGLSR